MLYLVARNMMNWRIPTAILTTVVVFSGVLYLVDPQRYASSGVHALLGWPDARRGVHGHRHGRLADDLGRCAGSMAS